MLHSSPVRFKAVDRGIGRTELKVGIKIQGRRFLSSWIIRVQGDRRPLLLQTRHGFQKRAIAKKAHVLERALREPRVDK